MNIEEIIKIIEKEFANGQVKQMDCKELISKLEKEGIEREKIDDALHEAQRWKILRLDSGLYTWIDASLRDAEKAKTQRYYEMLAEIYKEGRVKFLPREDLKAVLRQRGLGDEEVMRLFAEAERDHVLAFYSDTFGPDGNLIAGSSWIPPDQRKMEADAEKERRKSFEKWLEKKILQEETWKE